MIRFVPSCVTLRRDAHGASRAAWQVMFALVLCVAATGGRTAHAADRVALLIGNNNYGAAPLRNAVNDARDLGQALSELGFKTIVRENTSRQDMITAIREFGSQLEGAQVALFFYAGHAMQFKDRNFLVPVDAAMGSEDDITFYSVDVTQVMDRMERAKTRFNFVILDACRDNPFSSNFRLSASGLAQMSAPSGTLIAYSTAPGSVAADGYGRNGTYTKYILQQVKVPDQPVEIMFKRVRESVERETRKLQTPWDSSSLKGDFVFNASAGGPSQASANGPSSDAQLAIEREFWISVRDSNRAEDIQAYLEKYPSGQFVSLARNRIDALLRPARTQVASAEPRPAPASTTATNPSVSARPGPGSTPPANPNPAEKSPVRVTESAPSTKISTAPSTRPQTQSKPPAAEPHPDVAVVSAPPHVVAEPAASVSASAAAEAKPEVVASAAPSAPKPDATTLTTVSKDVEPGIKEVQFPDGSIYRGGVRGTALHGSGEFVSKDGFRYQGDFKDGRKEGKGIYAWPNGDVYEGDFSDDKPNGKGVYKFSNGDRYDGEVRNSVISGDGVYVTKAGDQIRGPFVEGKATGKGIYQFASGDRYEGELAQGRITGKGLYVSAAGDKIEGRFVDGRPESGVYRFTNGDRYEGEMRNGALTGHGTYFYSNGLKYEGELVLGKPNGKGTFWFNDGTRFEGDFEDGLKKAVGFLVANDGTRNAAQIIDGTVRLTN